MSLYKRALRTFDTATLTASFQDIGAQVGFPVSKMAIFNPSNVDILITDQLSEDDIEVPAGGTLSLGEGLSNDNGTSTKFVFPANVQLQIKQVTGVGTGIIVMQLFG